MKQCNHCGSTGAKHELLTDADGSRNWYCGSVGRCLARGKRKPE